MVIREVRLWITIWIIFKFKDATILQEQMNSEKINESRANMDSAEQYGSCNNIKDSQEIMESSKVSEKIKCLNTNTI